MRYSCRNLPEILETAEQKGKVLVLEEFIQGDTLDFLLKAAPLSSKATRETVVQICWALRVPHSFGAGHQDIKPENVIPREREAVLIDFDAARLPARIRYGLAALAAVLLAVFIWNLPSRQRPVITEPLRPFMTQRDGPISSTSPGLIRPRCPLATGTPPRR